ncbi:MAG: glutathione binding-like protein, partial [Gluconacetobacter sp.]
FASRIAKGVQTQLLDPEIKRHTAFWEESLTQTGWFAGDSFSAADIQMSFPLEAASARTGAVRHLPHVGAFLRRIHARPAWRRALERGGPYAYAAT